MITLTVLLQLRTEKHGYALRQVLSELGLPLTDGTIYPLLRRLEDQRVLSSRWDTSAVVRPRPLDGRRCAIPLEL
jgi:PadR family transcriptional regulator PadR